MATSPNDYWIEQWFPAASKDGYEITSREDPDYNCIAWAANDTDLAWWPVEAPGAYWPPGVPLVHSLEAFIQAYGTLGYRPCGKNGRLQEGYEKIAIYVDWDGKPTHAARQLSSGHWTSKIGQYKDIRHATVSALENSDLGETDYGVVAIYLRRRIPGTRTTFPLTTILLFIMAALVLLTALIFFLKRRA